MTRWGAGKAGDARPTLRYREPEDRTRCGSRRTMPGLRLL